VCSEDRAPTPVGTTVRHLHVGIADVSPSNAYRTRSTGGVKVLRQGLIGKGDQRSKEDDAKDLGRSHGGVVLQYFLVVLGEDSCPHEGTHPFASFPSHALVAAVFTLALRIGTACAARAPFPLVHATASQSPPHSPMTLNGRNAQLSHPGTRPDVGVPGPYGRRPDHATFTPRKRLRCHSRS